MNKLWLTILIVLAIGCSAPKKNIEPPVILIKVPEGISDIEITFETKDCTNNWNFCKWQ